MHNDALRIADARRNCLGELTPAGHDASCFQNRNAARYFTYTNAAVACGKVETIRHDTTALTSLMLNQLVTSLNGSSQA